MIKELVWDTVFFKKRIGELTISSGKPYSVETDIKKARANGFKYIICRLNSQQTADIKLLESSRFYLSDIGVTWAIRTGDFLCNKKNKDLGIKWSIRAAADKDIPGLKKISKSLFADSRFYNDPFYSKREADRLYMTWIENSVKGKFADAVFYIPGKGFITCRKAKRNKGEIKLIGIARDYRRKGAGTVLIEEAMDWFKHQDIDLVSARTQLRNLDAMNFYLRLGFYIKGYDILFGKIL